MRMIIALAVVLFTAPSFAANYFVSKVRGNSGDPSLNASIRELVTTAVGEADQDVVASEEQADFVLEGSLLPLGSAHILTLKKRKGSKVIFSGKMKAESANELDVIVSRLTLAVIKEQNPADNPTVGQITDKEVNQVSRRTESRQYKYISFGPYQLSQMQNQGVAYGLSGGQIWEVDTHAAIRADVSVSFGASEPVGMFTAALLGANYYFSPTSQTLYVSGGFGYGASTTKATSLENTAGFAIGAGIGYLFFRTSGTQMSVEARYVQLLASNGDGSPGHLGLALGIHF